MISVQNARLVEFKFGIKLDSLSFFLCHILHQFFSSQGRGAWYVPARVPIGNTSDSEKDTSEQF